MTTDIINDTVLTKVHRILLFSLQKEKNSSAQIPLFFILHCHFTIKKTLSKNE